MDITKIKIEKIECNQVEACENTEVTLTKSSSPNYNLYVSKQDIEDLTDFYNKQLSKPSKLVKPSGKKIALFYSGGYDSTCLLLKNLEAGNEVYPIEVIFSRDESFLKRVTLYQLQKIYGKELLHDITVVGDYYDTPDRFERCGFSQQPVCAFNAAFIPSDILTKVSEIQLGYVMCDYAISFLDELRQLYESALVFKNYPEDVKLPILTFPLKQTCHEDTINYVLDWSNKNNTTLACTSCEHLDMRVRKLNKNTYEYKVEECGTCHKCKTQNHSSIYKIKVMFKED